MTLTWLSCELWASYELVLKVMSCQPMFGRLVALVKPRCVCLALASGIPLDLDGRRPQLSATASGKELLLHTWFWSDFANFWYFSLFFHFAALRLL